ncbi:MAG: PadR family transcriptional regulator [Clostridia bacterium]
MSIKLIILGLLMDGDRHPYEIQQLVLERGMDHYIKFAKGSLYYACDQLHKQGSIEVIDVIREANRPEKTVYRITAQGIDEFQELMVHELQQGIRLHNPAYAALTFARHGDKTAMVQALEGNIREVEQVKKKLEMVLERKGERIDTANRYILYGGLEHFETELRWLNRVKADVLEGKL